jgi:PhoH-like ATPase
MLIWGGPLADHLGGMEMLEQLIEEGIIEIFPLSHIRGRSIKDSIVICDECENMNDKLVTLLMSRIEDGSELIFCGDVAQIDNRKFEVNNGIVSMIKHLAGQPLFGTVKLLKSERGPVAELCNLIRPPV